MTKARLLGVTALTVLLTTSGCAGALDSQEVPATVGWTIDERVDDLMVDADASVIVGLVQPDEGLATVIAWDATDGSELWRGDVPKPRGSDAMVVTADAVVVAGSNADGSMGVRALDLRSGTDLGWGGGSVDASPTAWPEVARLLPCDFSERGRACFIAGSPETSMSTYAVDTIGVEHLPLPEQNVTFSVSDHGVITDPRTGEISLNDGDATDWTLLWQSVFDAPTPEQPFIDIGDSPGSSLVALRTNPTAYGETYDYAQNTTAIVDVATGEGLWRQAGYVCDIDDQIVVLCEQTREGDDLTEFRASAFDLVTGEQVGKTIAFAEAEIARWNDDASWVTFSTTGMLHARGDGTPEIVSWRDSSTTALPGDASVICWESSVASWCSSDGTAASEPIVYESLLQLVAWEVDGSYVLRTTDSIVRYDVGD